MRYKEGILHTTEVINLEFAGGLFPFPTGNKSIASIFKYCIDTLRKDSATQLKVLLIHLVILQLCSSNTDHINVYSVSWWEMYGMSNELHKQCFCILH